MMEVLVTANADTPEVQNDLKKNLVDMAIEAWRFSKVFERMMTQLDAGENNRYVNQLRWFLKKIESTLEGAGLRMISIEGHMFDPGIAATPLNLGDFDPGASLIVEQMIEPIIMEQDKLFRTGTVMLRRSDA